MRYLRDVPLRGVLAAWAQSFAPVALPAEFTAWLAPMSAGAWERDLFLPEGLRLEATGRSAVQVPAGPASRIVLDAWIGARALTEALRRGLLGG